jgi:hypothetical protein
LPGDAFEYLLRHAIQWLAPDGIAILTVHGRWTIRRQTNTQYKYMDEASFGPILDGIRRDGFGYTNYIRADSRLGQKSYGHSVSLPSWVMRTVETIEEVRLLDYQERGWDNHQDVLVLRKSPIGAQPWLFEEGFKSSTGSGHR